jgi:hypothetical protein
LKGLKESANISQYQNIKELLFFQLFSVNEPHTRNWRKTQPHCMKNGSRGWANESADA